MINEAQKTLLSLLGKNLFAVPFTPAPDTDWQAVFKESCMQSVVICAFNNHSELPLDPETRASVVKRIRKTTLSNIICFKNHSYVHSLMTGNDIPYCILKGAASAHYYDEPLCRCMGDVDFYVHPDDLERAQAVFEREGFVRTDKNHLIHAVLKKDNVHCEMHFAPIAEPDGHVGEIYRKYWEDIRECSGIVCDHPAEYSAPSDFHHGLITLAHIQHHLVAEGVGLRHLCDWAVFVNSFSDEEFAVTFEERLKRVGLWRLARLLGLAASEYLGLPYKNWMGDERDLASELMNDILAGGNFGRKDRQRQYEGLFISDRGKNGFESNRFAQVFRSLNRIVRSQWKIVEKLPLLYPVGWLYFSVRYLVRLLLGKRKLDIADTYKQSGKRKELYKKFKLFEPED